jgi:hypothetical protein
MARREPLNFEFQYRDKIAIALQNLNPTIQDKLVLALSQHRWFEFTTENDFQLLITAEAPAQPVGCTVIVLNGKQAPALYPDVNPNALKHLRPSTGDTIVRCPTSASLGLALALKPIQDLFEITAVEVKARVPEPLEQERLESEPLELLFGNQQASPMTIHAHCSQVPISQGTTLAISMKLMQKPSLLELENSWRTFDGYVLRNRLPSASNPPITVYSEANYPESSSHPPNLGIGKLRCCANPGDYQFTLVPPDRTNSLLTLAETLVLSGLVYW